MEIVSGLGEKPHVTSQQFRQILEGTIGQESYIVTSGENLEPELAANNLLKIRSGMMSHHGNVSSVKIGTYDEVELTNGSQGMKRIDLVVNRYTRNAETNIEKNEWVVIMGTPVASNPVAPAYTVGNLQKGDLVDDCPVFELHYDGINVTEVKKMLSVLPNVAELNSKISYNFESLAWKNPTYHITKKSGIIHIDYHCVVSGGVSGMSFLVAKLPSAICPKNTIKSQAWTANGSSQRHGASIEIKPNGQIYLVAGDSFVEAGFTVSYPL